MSVLEFLRNDTNSCECVLKLNDLSVYADADALVWMVFDLKERPVNVVNLDILGQAEQVMVKLEELISAGRCKVILIASGKSNMFIAGADIDALYPNVDPLEAEAAARLGQKAFQRLHQLPVPTVALINGAALGAGLEISLASTYRICADNSQIQLGLPEVKLGLLPGAGGTVRLAKLIGLQQALAIILSGASVRPKKALEIGLIDAVLPYQDRTISENRFFAESRKFALKLIDKPSCRQLSGPFWRGSIGNRLLDGTSFGRYVVAKKAAEKLDAMSGGRYPAPYLALDSVMHAFSCEEDDALRYEARLFGRLAATPESKSLMALFYMMENSKKTRQRLKARPLPIQKIGVIGAGVMGVQIATILARKGFKVYMRDIKSEFIASGLSRLSSFFADLVSRGRMTASKAAASTALVEGGTGIDGFADCQVVIETAVEQMNLKQRILAEVEKVLQPTAIFASNTSSLSIEELAASAEVPQRVLGMHFFNPVTKMPLVEVIKGSNTCPEAIATIYHLSLLLGKTPVICRDGPGFVVNRILGIYMNEAGNLAMEGNSIQAIDNALLAFGMPMGPFRLMDEVGLDVAAHVAPVLQKGLGDRFQQHPEFGAILNANPQTLGKKTKAGFFLYNDAGKVTGLNSVLEEALRHVVQRSDLDGCSQQDITDRCILLSLQEAARILEEGLVASAEELDIAMVLGTGFAPFRGGLLNYADQRGLSEIVQRLGAMKLQYGERFEPQALLCRMAERGERFFPDRPIGMKRLDTLPRSKL